MGVGEQGPGGRAIGRHLQMAEGEKTQPACLRSHRGQQIRWGPDPGRWGGLPPIVGRLGVFWEQGRISRASSQMPSPPLGIQQLQKPPVFFSRVHRLQKQSERRAPCPLGRLPSAGSVPQPWGGSWQASQA